MDMKFKYNFSEQEIAFSFLWGNDEYIARADMHEISYGEIPFCDIYSMHEIVCFEACRNGEKVNNQNLENLSRHLTHILKHSTEIKGWVEFFNDCVDKFFEKMYGQ